MPHRLQAIYNSLTSSVPESAWRIELERNNDRFHSMAAWVAVFFVPVFGITDYMNIPDHWHEVFFIRIFNSLLTLAFILNRKRWGINSATFAAVPFLFISLQNAFTFRYLTEAQLVSHALNYIALMIGAGMFLMWDLRTSMGVLVPSAIVTGIFVGLNPRITADQYFSNGGLLVTSVGIFMAVVIEFRRNLTIKEIKATLALKAANDELAIQKAEIEAKNESINDSINYAKRLQDSMLGDASPLESWFRDSMLLFAPKDVLSGDFYWFHRDEHDGSIIIAVADCTGHGVPAAMMTVMGQGLLNRIVTEQNIISPEKILEELDKQVIAAFAKVADNNNQVNDGMDISVAVIKGNRLLFSGAKCPLVIVKSDATITQFKGSRYPVGSTQYDDSKEFALFDLTIHSGDRLYMFSDGFADQFGGENDRKFRSRNLLQLIEVTQNLPMAQQREQLLSAHRAWKGDREQTDDILVLGIEI